MKKLAEMNLVELKKKFKSRRFITGLLVAIITGIFLVVFIFKTGSSTSSKILPFAFLPMLIIQIFQDYKLYKELKSRQE